MATRATAKMVDGGRIIVPAEFRRAMGVAPGDTLVLSLEGEALRVQSHRAVVREIQASVRALVPPGVSLVDELIAERRAEAARE
ncbi:AbrB family transcriptional regulator [alpha proteobacterium AAP81b]|nr:AbrB family transcriptional regulator [alpha proteobacterium AAP81b]